MQLRNIFSLFLRTLNQKENDTLMNYFESEYFRYKGNQLFCEDTPLSEIAETQGTPTYVYSKKFFRDRYNEINEAFAGLDHTVFFACKSNFNLSVIKTFVDAGSGVDVNSEGELIRALKAGADPGKIVMSGVGKTQNEIKLAIEKDILMIKAESEEEILLINEIAGALNARARLAIRVNPDVDAKTHPYISTGLAKNKFGVDATTALRLFKMEKELENIKYTGIDMHIGSQITKVEPFVEAVEKLAELFLKVKSEGVNLEHIDLGGGIGVAYNNEKTFTVNEYADAVLPVLQKLNCKIFLEPGRYMTANGGILIAQVLYTKKNHDKNFIITDGAMNDLLRPSIYGAYHHIQPLTLTKDKKDITADVVGPVCESGDFLAKDVRISECRRGEYIAVLSAGAYGMVMSSNYNMRKRPAEVLVEGNKFKIVRRRETFEQLLSDEISLL